MCKAVSSSGRNLRDNNGRRERRAWGWVLKSTLTWLGSVVQGIGVSRVKKSPSE